MNTTNINFNYEDVLTNSALINKLINNNLDERNHITLVKVVAVDESAMTVDVTPLILEQDTQGEAQQPLTIYDVSYYQIQSGESAIIITPTVDDIGLAFVCDRDISAIKETKKEAMPASYRRNSLSDSIYFGGMLNKTPKQIIKFTDKQIEITSPKPIVINSDDNISIKAPNITLDGNVKATKAIEASQDITSKTDVKAGSTSLKTHVHAGVETGGGVTGTPQ